jgi:hypothetical protein
MNRYAKVLTASAHPYTAQTSAAAQWAKGRTPSLWIDMRKPGQAVPWLTGMRSRVTVRGRAPLSR